MFSDDENWILKSITATYSCHMFTNKKYKDKYSNCAFLKRYFK